jgi:pyroglutamyl-peptidase
MPPSPPRTGRSGLRILVTAFGSFPGARLNPTQAIAARLAASRRLARLGVRVLAHTLPVEYRGAAERLSALVAQTRPDAILHLGLAARRKHISVESRAINRQSLLRVDAARRLPGQSVIADGFPHTLPARWPAARIAAAMSAAGAPARVSIDAGDYICNQTLFLTLASTRAPAGFIHTPSPRRSAGMTLSAITRAVETAVVVLASDVRRGRRASASGGPAHDA